MKFSIRILLVSIVCLSVVFAIYANTRVRIQDVADLELDDHYRIHIYAAHFAFHEDERQLHVVIYKDEEVYVERQTLLAPYLDRDPVIKVAYTDDKRYVCVYDTKDADLQVMGDLLMGRFMSRQNYDTLIHYGEPSVHQESWRAAVTELREANPDLPIF